MAQNTNITCAPRTWTLITNSNVTILRATVLSNQAVWLQAAVGVVEPTTTDGALPLLPGQILAGDLDLSQLWPGLAGANRVYAYAPEGAELSVSHA